MDGKICFVFFMIELVVVLFDVFNLEIIIVWDGNDYVINGCKWFMFNVFNFFCEVFVVMGKMDLVVECYW